MDATLSGDGLGLRPSATSLSSMGAQSLPEPASPPARPPFPAEEQTAARSGRSTFRDILHALNPLQHLPVVGMIYRAVTGDTISPAVRIAGSVVTSMLMGGPIGILGTAIGCLAEEMWDRGWNQPDGLMPLSYSAGAEAAIPSQATMLPLLASAAPPASPASAVLAGPSPESSQPPVHPPQVGAALAAYARVEASGWRWQATERG